MPLSMCQTQARMDGSGYSGCAASSPALDSLAKSFTTTEAAGLNGIWMRPRPRGTVADQLASLLLTNPGATVVEFERLAVDCDLGRARARTFLTDGVLSGAIRREKGAGRVMRHFLAGEANG